jgi:hypothetical protein
VHAMTSILCRVVAMHRFVPCLSLLAGCYHPASETSCMVACAVDGTCPTGLTCGSDQLCHSGAADCTELVSGTYGHTLITNTTSGAPTSSNLTLTTDQLDLSVVLDDTGAKPPITFDGDTFSFARNTADEPYRFTEQALEETALSTEIQDDVPMLTLWSPYFGRQIRSGVNQPTPLNFTLDLNGTAPTHSYVSSTGLRTFAAASGVVTMGSAMTFSFDWRTAGSLFGGLGLLQASEGDVLWYTGLAETVAADGNAYDNYYAMVGMVREMVTLSNGGTTPIAATITPTPANLCVELMMPRLTETTRVGASTPFGSGMTPLSSWNITSTPYAAITPAAGIAIVEAYSASTIIDQDTSIAYANPYPEDQIAYMYAFFRRDSMLGSASLPLDWGTSQYMPVPSATAASCAQVAMSATIAMPGVPTLGGTPLDTDGQTVTIDSSGPITLDFTPTAAGSGSADDWTVELYQVTPSGTTLSLATLRVYWTRTPSVSIDPLLFVPGQLYLFQLNARIGFPQASSGNYQPVSYPYGTSAGYSAVFQVGS